MVQIIQRVKNEAISGGANDTQSALRSLDHSAQLLTYCGLQPCGATLYSSCESCHMREHEGMPKP
jgi:hypothetical protein